MNIVDLKALQTPKFGLKGLGTWIMQTIAKTTAREIMNLRWNGTTEVGIQKPWSSRSAPHVLRLIQPI
jgi:hypothetical protein